MRINPCRRAWRLAIEYSGVREFSGKKVTVIPANGFARHVIIQRKSMHFHKCGISFDDSAAKFPIRDVGADLECFVCVFSECA
jgi:hypothetical protein